MITTVTLNASIDKAYHMEGSIENGTVMRVKAVRNSAGGKGLNVARVVRLCGEEAFATGLVGGYNGKYLESLLERDGIAHDFEHIAGETRSCINILDETYGSTEYLEPGCAVTQEEKQKFLARFPQIIAGSSVVTISGSIPEGLPENLYQEMILTVKAAGGKVILDTSGEALRQGMKAAPTLVKPNQEELELFFGRKANGQEDMIEMAKEIYAQGVANVVISLGKDGALLVCRDGVLRAAAPKVEAVNTVGCGDSMVGAMAVALHRGWEPEQMLRYAVAAASANALSPNTGDFEPEICKRLFQEVKCRKISEQ